MLRNAAFLTHTHTYTHTHRGNQTFTFHPSVSIKPISLFHSITPACTLPLPLSLSLRACLTPSLTPSLPHTCRQPHTPVGVMLRSSLLTFPGRPLKLSRLSCLCKRCRRGAAVMEVKGWRIEAAR